MEENNYSITNDVGTLTTTSGCDQVTCGTGSLIDYYCDYPNSGKIVSYYGSSSDKIFYKKVKFGEFYIYYSEITGVAIEKLFSEDQEFLDYIKENRSELFDSIEIR